MQCTIMQRASLRSRQSVGSNVGSEIPAYALNLIVHVYIAKLMEYKYGIHGEKGYAKSMDGGERWMLVAADGQPVCTWDSRGHKLHTEYDELRRPTRQWLNEGTLVGETVYGTDAANNLIGQPWKIHDQSGTIENTRYDFKGNLLESRRKFTQEYKQTIDWNANPALESEEFVSRTEYDALNRAASISTPHNANVPASEIMPAYDEGGLLKTVKAKLRGSAQETAFVTGIAYNPKGQREKIKYGNGAVTEYEYDENNFRLTKLLTTRNNGADVLQDLNYAYDQMGNIVGIADNAQEVVFFDNQQVNPSQTFEYDALYRLTGATGREHIGSGADTEPETDGYPLVRETVPQDASALRNYTRKWKYDQVGNILEMIHIANNNNGSWTRNYSYASNSNRLNSTTVGQNTVSYAYNEHGSMASMPHLQAMEWDFMERLSHITRGTTEAYYSYDGGGQRTRKVVEKNNVVEERLYLGGVEIFRKKSGNILELERETLHIMDGFENNEPEEKESENGKEAEGIGSNAKRAMNNKRRVAIIETKTWENGTQIANPIPMQKYQLSNNIESATLELDETASIISYEEYYPYGDTSYQAGRSTSEVSQKRYRYTGKEKDEESGLYYYGARYYSTMIGIFISMDPKFEKYLDVSPYAHCMNNPVKYIDPNGEEIILEGTSEEDMRTTLNLLQKLTNDKLSMHSNNDGTSTVIIEKIGGEHKGKYLKVGSELIRELNKKGNGARKAIIFTGTYNENRAYIIDDGSGESIINDPNDKGANASIEFDSTLDPCIPTVNSNGYVSNKKRPSEIGLAHELIHAYNINKGITINDEVELTYLIDAGTYTSIRTEEVYIEELNTIGLSIYDGSKFTENKIRKEQKLPLRGGYIIPMGCIMPHISEERR